MIIRSLLRGAGVLALAMAGPGFGASALASDGANVRGLGSVCNTGACGFAGYNVYLGDYGFPSSVSATTTFKVPKLRCGKRRNRAIAPAVGALVGPNVGVPRLWEAAMFVGCRGGKAHYWPELVVRGRIKNYPAKAAHAGDTIVLRLESETGDVSAVDETHRFKVSRTVAIARGGHSVQSAWIGDEGWLNSHGYLEGAPDFGTLTYSSSRLYGHPLGQSNFVERENRTSVGQINTGPLFSGGKAFRTYFKHS